MGMGRRPEALFLLGCCTAFLEGASIGAFAIEPPRELGSLKL